MKKFLAILIIKKPIIERIFFTVIDLWVHSDVANLRTFEYSAQTMHNNTIVNVLRKQITAHKSKSQLIRKKHFSTSPKQCWVPLLLMIYEDGKIYLTKCMCERSDY